MTPSSAKYLFCLSCLLVFATAGRAQDMPAVSGPPVYQGFSLPAAGDLAYSLTGSESARFGYYNSVVTFTTLSGDLAYLSGSTLNPFRVTYSGGFSQSTGYPNAQPSRIFQNVRVSQDVHRHYWSMNVNDTFTYLPDAPVSGLSGIPGLGDTGVTPPPSTGGAGQSALTNFATRVENTAGGSFSRTLTGRTSIGADADYDVLKFVGDNVTNAISSNGVNGSFKVSHTISPIRSYFVQYSHGYFTYPDTSVPFSFFTDSVQVGYNANLSRQTTVMIAGGPQRTSTNSAGTGGVGYDVNINGQITHTAERSDILATFSRAARSGSGITPGAINTSAAATFKYRASRVSSLSAVVNYTYGSRLSALSTSDFTTQTFTGTVEGERQISRFLSGYLSVSLLKQSLGGSVNTSTAFNGFSQIVAVGITYAPRPIHLGH